MILRFTFADPIVPEGRRCGLEANLQRRNSGGIKGIKRRGPHLTMWSSLTFKKLTIKHGYLILYPKTFLFSLGIWCKGNTCFLNLQENVLPESSCLLQNATNYCYITSVYVCGNIFVSIMCVFFFVKLNVLYCRTQFFNVILLLFQ